jgi:hypothetical protein
VCKDIVDITTEVIEELPTKETRDTEIGRISGLKVS